MDIITIFGYIFGVQLISAICFGAITSFNVVVNSKDNIINDDFQSTVINLCCFGYILLWGIGASVYEFLIFPFMWLEVVYNNLINEFFGLIIGFI